MRYRDALYEVWELKFENTAKYYAAAVAGLIALITIVRWVNIILEPTARKWSLYGRLNKSFMARKRRVDAAMARHTSLSPLQAVLVLVFLGINAILTFYDHPQNAGLLSIMAKKFGW